MVDLVEKLQGAPRWTPLYSPICGKCYLYRVINNPYNTHLIEVSLYPGSEAKEIFTRDGRYKKCYVDGECLLFPDKDQRDWDKFKNI